MMQFFDTHAKSEIIMRLNASSLSDSSIDTHINSDLHVNSENDATLIAAYLMMQFLTHMQTLKLV